MLIFRKFYEGKLHVLGSYNEKIDFFADEDSWNFRLHVKDIV